MRQPTKIASIDVGTNTVRCLIGELNEGKLETIQVHRKIIRLGSGLKRSKIISDIALSDLLEVLGTYSGYLKVERCSFARAVGTSALRDAVNSSDIQDVASSVLGLPLEVISGEEEARLTASGVQAGIGSINDGMVLDIGGGSMELVRVNQNGVSWYESIQAGVIHLTDSVLLSDPPTPVQVGSLRKLIADMLRDLDDDAGEVLAGTAGTPTTMAAVDLGIDEYDPTLVNGHVISRNCVNEILDLILGMRASDRLKIPGMEKGREDLIPSGIVMVEEVMDRWNFDSITVSDWGLLEGVAISIGEGVGYEVNW